MSTPSDPATPQAAPVPTPSVPLSTSDDQIRQLAAQLNQPPYNFDPSTIRKAVITAVDPGDATTPPTATILFSGDTTAPVSGVRMAAGYGPQVDDTVIVLKQGSDFFLLTSIAKAGSQTASSTVGGWTQVGLNSMHSHGGNSNGNVMFRRVMDNGCWKMQWKGAMAYGANTFVLAASLDPDYRPAAKVSMVTAREVSTGGGVSVGVDFNTDGTVTIVAPTWSTSSTGSHSHSHSHPHTHTHSHTHSHSHSASLSVSVSGSGSGSGTSGSGGADNHTHAVATGDSFTGTGTASGTTGSDATSGGSNNSSSDSTSDATTGGTHSHTASNPTWISFNGLEYFLG